MRRRIHFSSLVAGILLATLLLALAGPPACADDLAVIQKRGVLQQIAGQLGQA